MSDNIHSALNSLHQFLMNSEISNESKEQVANFLLDISLRAKGYNNSQDFFASGENWFFKNILKKINPTICVDVGANVGDYSREILENTDSVVYSFEPLLESFNKLLEIKSSYGDRFIPINKGIGERDEYLNLYFNKDVTAHATFSTEVQEVPYLKNQSIERIEVVKLDSFFQGFRDKSIDFIKIDTEGFEWEVLNGARNVLKAHKPKLIQIEFNWHQLFRSHTLYAFSEVLFDYKVFQLVPNGMIERDPKDPYVNIFHFSNFIFARKDLF